MSQQGDLESAIRSAVEAIELATSVVFADVAGWAGRFDRSALDRIGRLRKPAALVGFVEQRSGEGQRWAVAIAGAGLRGGDEARTGSDDVMGIFQLLALVRASLDGQTLGSGDRLTLVEEKLLDVDERVVICQQLYRAERAGQQPQYDGKAICGEASCVQVTVGSIEKEVVEFGFAGIDGVYRHEMGLRGRTIEWQGELRAADAAALDAIESGLEDYVADPSSHDLSDEFGRSFSHCVLDGFERRGARHVDAVTSRVRQTFRLMFRQLDVT